MSKAISTVGFDYSSIDKDLKSKLHSWAGEYRRNLGHCLHHIVEIGKVLNKVIEEMAKCGCEVKFATWVREELGISRQSAYHYMNAATRFGDDCKSLLQFTAEAVYELSWDKVPQEAIDTAINLANKGTRITKDTAAELKRRFTSNGDTKHEGPKADPADGAEDQEVQGAGPEPDDAGAEASLVHHRPSRAGRSPEEMAQRELVDLFKETELIYKYLVQNLSIINRRTKHRLYGDCNQSLDISYKDFRTIKKDTLK